MKTIKSFVRKGVTSVAAAAMFIGLSGAAFAGGLPQTVPALKVTGGDVMASTGAAANAGSAFNAPGVGSSIGIGTVSTFASMSLSRDTITGSGLTVATAYTSNPNVAAGAASGNSTIAGVVVQVPVFGGHR